MARTGDETRTSADPHVSADLHLVHASPVLFEFLAPRLQRRVMLVMLAIVAVVFAACVAAWWPAPIVAADTAGYQVAGRDIADGSIDALQLRPPGYPFLLGLTGSTDQPTTALLVVQLICYLMAVWVLTVQLTHYVSDRWPVVGLLVVGLLPPFVEQAAVALTEAPTALLLSVGVAAYMIYLRRPSFGLTLTGSCLLAVSSLFRPTYQLLAPSLATAVFVVMWSGVHISSDDRPTRRRLAAHLLLTPMIMTLVVVGGLSTFNFAKFGYFGVTPLVGWNLATRTSTFVQHLPDRYARERAVLVQARDETLVSNDQHTAGNYVYSARQQIVDGLGLSGVDLHKHMLEMQVHLILSKPDRYMLEVGRASGIYWLPMFEDVIDEGSPLLRYMYALVHVVVVALFFLQLAVTLTIAIARGREGLLTARGLLACWLAIGAVLYTYTVSVTFDTGNPRFNDPVQPLMLFATAFGLHAVPQIRSRWLPTKRIITLPDASEDVLNTADDGVARTVT